MADTIVAISTALQNSAIGVIRLSGERAIDIAQRACGKTLYDRTALFCTVTDGNGEVLDKCVCTAFFAPRSYTGENTAEFSCHGGMVVLDSVMRRLCELGARPAERGEFTKRAFLNGKMDLSQSEAVIDIITAKSALSVKEAFSQVAGNIKHKICALRDSLCDIDAEIMAYVDFSAEGIDAPDSFALIPRLEAVKKEILSLCSTYGRGRIIKEGYPVCLCGKPNVGKSSVMNALLGTERSIVTPLAGTTRDVISETVQIDGLAVLLADTAGLHETDSEVEKIGIARARDIIKESGLIICIFDASLPLDENDDALLALAKGENALAVINKTDLAVCLDTKTIEAAFANTVYISAKNSEGLDALRAKIKESALGGAQINDETLITSLRHKNALDAAADALSAAIERLEDGVDAEICELDIAAALSHLGEITGECVREDMIERIFENFCVGK